MEKSLGGYCSTFICNGLHTYALSIFGSFVKMSVLFNFVCVCVHILFFSNMSFFAFQWKICGFMCKNRTQDFGVLISQQFILHGTFGKKLRSGVFHVPVCYFLIKITSLYINWEKLSGKCIYLYIRVYICYFPCLLPPTQERAFTLYYIIFLRDLHSSLASLGQLFFPFQTLDAAGRGCRLIFSFFLLI